MKRDKLETLITTLICLLPILVGLAVYDRLPELVPTHFDANGAPNGYSSRAVAVFGLPAFMAAINLFVRFALSTDPKKANMNPMLKRLSFWIVPILSVLCNTMVLGFALGYVINISAVIPALVGVLFIIIGNYLPKTKQSYTMGIKLPWTLHSAENWNRTHRLAGFLWMIGGAVMVVCALLHFLPGWLLIALAMLLTLIPTAYSYLLYRKGI